MPAHWIRDGIPLVVLILVLSGIVGVAWLSHHPKALAWDVLESTPLVGDRLAELRDGFRPPPESTSRRPGRTDGGSTTEGYERIVVTPELPPWPGNPEYVWVLDGATLHRGPSVESPVVFRTEAIANLPRLERRGEWFRVWRRGLEGWVHLPDYRDDGGPPYGDGTIPPGPLEPRPADDEAILAVRALMGDRAHHGRLGPYELWTDLTPSAPLLRALDRVAEQVDSLYARRYGRTPLGTPRATVAVFADLATYREFQTSTSGIESLDAVGHANSGLAALYVGDRRRHAVVSTLIHELTHLVNRRAIGPALPPWLDEGLCEDMANSRVDLDGTIDPSRLGGVRLDWSDHWTMEGATASLWALRDAETAGTRPDLRSVLGYDWRQFVVSDSSRLHYDISSFFVRFLLDPRTPERGDALRSFLDTVAAGEPPDPEALRAKLGASWTALDAELGRWILEQARAVGPPTS